MRRKKKKAKKKSDGLTSPYRILPRNSMTNEHSAAVAAMAPVVTHNLQRVMQGKQPSAQYDGYSSCPIPLSYDKLLLT